MLDLTVGIPPHMLPVTCQAVLCMARFEGNELKPGYCICPCAGPSDNSGATGSLQEAVERTSSTEGSLAQPGPPTMPRPGAQCLSDEQLDILMGQLASMHDDKMRKDLLGRSPALPARNNCIHYKVKDLMKPQVPRCMQDPAIST